MKRLSDFMNTVPIGGSCLALRSLVTGVQLVSYLIADFSIMYLTAGVVYLITMMKTFGWQVRVEASVDIGGMLGAMVFLLLTGLVLLVQYHSCMS